MARFREWSGIADWGSEAADRGLHVKGGLSGPVGPGVPARPSPASAALPAFLDLARRNRLEGLVAALPFDAGGEPAWERALAELAEGAAAALLHDWRRLAAGARLQRELEADGGVRSVAVRGAFASARWYGGVGRRRGGDVDLMIDPADREAAWQWFAARGWRLARPALSRRFCERHHLAWSLTREGEPCVDLHWAADHALMPWRVDLRGVLARSAVLDREHVSWRAPCAEDEAVLAAIHLRKECGPVGRPGFAARCALQGHWRCWLDAALARAAGEPAVMRRRAAAWGAEDLWAQTERTLDAWRAAEAEAADAAVWARGPVRRSPWERWTLRRVGVRAWRIREALGGGMGGGTRRRIGRALAVCGAALEAGTGRLRQALRPAGLALLLGVGLAAAHEFGDDAGDSPAEALSITNGGVFAIEIDTDRDWFRFEALPWSGYTVTLSTVSIADAALAAAAHQGTEAFGAGSTLPARQAVSLHAFNSGPLATWYVEVGGMFEFTTGTYVLAVSSTLGDPEPPYSPPESWKTAWLQGTDLRADGDDPDQDGADNRAEYLAGTDPLDRDSVLRIQQVHQAAGGNEVNWSGATGGWYRLSVTTNLLEPGAWMPVATNTDAQDAGRVAVDAGAGDGVPRFYRVELIP